MFLYRVNTLIKNSLLKLNKHNTILPTKRLFAPNPCSVGWKSWNLNANWSLFVAQFFISLAEFPCFYMHFWKYFFYVFWAYLKAFFSAGFGIFIAAISVYLYSSISIHVCFLVFCCFRCTGAYLSVLNWLSFICVCVHWERQRSFF